MGKLEQSGSTLVASYPLGPLHQVWVQEALQVPCVFLQQPFLLLLDDADAPQFGDSPLLCFPLFLGLGLPVLFQLHLPQTLHLSLVL